MDDVEVAKFLNRIMCHSTSPIERNFVPCTKTNIIQYFALIDAFCIAGSYDTKLKPSVV